METGRQAFVLFFAFFWAASINSTGRYQAFDTASIWGGNKLALNRFIAAILFLNILPILWFFIIYNYIIPNDNQLVSIIASSVASLSVFAYLRIFHSFVATETEYHNYYTLEQVEEVRERGEFIQPQNFLAHFIPGLLYLIIPILLSGILFIFF